MGTGLAGSESGKFEMDVIDQHTAAAQVDILSEAYFRPDHTIEARISR